MTIPMARLSRLLALFLFLIPTGSQAALNQFERKIIQEQITKSFNHMMKLWREELYFDLYSLGLKGSREIVSLEDFAQRMVDLKWKPSGKEESVKVTQIKIFYRNYAVVFFEIKFESKVDPSNFLSKASKFQMVLEQKAWRFDLTQFIRIPY